MADKIWQVALKSHHTASGAQVVNTFCVRDYSGVPLSDPLAAQTIASDVKSWIETEYKAVLSNLYTFDEVAVRELQTNEPTIGSVAVGAAGTLGAGTRALPREVCMVVTLHTSVATRSGRGRMFIPSPLYSSHLASQDAWLTGTGGWYAAVGDFFEKLLDGHDVEHDLIAHHLSTRVYSRRHNTSYDVTSYTRRLQPHWLRSRMSVP